MKKRTKIALIIVCLFVAICSAAIIVVFNFSSKQVVNVDFVPSKDAERFISDDLYYAATDESHIKINPETGLEYIDNEIILFAERDSTKEDITSLIRDKNGYVVGRAKEAYQLRFSESYDYETLSAIKNEYETSVKVDTCFVNIPMVETSGDSYFPTEKGNRWKDDWNASLPNGNNWGVEAIKAPEAWEYIDLMTEVKVGVFDSGFDKEHEDLKDNIASTSLDSKNKDIDHGTHVAGTIGAGFNNGKGVDGVFPKAKFSFIDISSASKDETQFFFVTAMKYLIEEQKCKAINVSLGFNEDIIYGASRGNERALKEIEECADIAEECLSNSLENNFDFVICQSAGNANDKLYKESKNKKYGYKIVTSGGENKGCKANYGSVFNAIDDEEVRKHIIVVGAVQNNSTDLFDYKVCDFSNIGDRVDVVAPGKDIESSVPDNKYGKKSGTSMATPHVAGIAAMLYSLYPDIKGDKVKKIICDTAIKRGDGYKFVDAEAAVKNVLGKGKITVKIVDSDDETPINGVKVSASIKIKSGEKLKEISYTNESGSLTMELPCSEYKIKFEKEGYKGKSIDVKIKKDITDLTYSHKPIAMEEFEKNTNVDSTATVAETTNASDNGWKQAYVEYLNNTYLNNEKSEQLASSDCYLVYINNDDIPELVVETGTVYAGAAVCSFNGEDVVTVQYYTGSIYYYEKENLFCIKWGRQGMYYDTVYTINNGEFNKTNDGKYLLNADSSGNIVEEYYWNGNKKSQEVYKKKLTEAFDINKATDVYSTKKYSINEVIAKLNT